MFENTFCWYLECPQLTINSLHTRDIFFCFYGVKIEGEARNSVLCTHSIRLAGGRKIVTRVYLKKEGERRREYFWASDILCGPHHMVEQRH
jgi:hypothetical protein